MTAGTSPRTGAPAPRRRWRRAEPDRPPFARSEFVIARDPADLTRLLWFLLVSGIGLVAALGAEQTTAGLEGDLVQLVSHLPGALLALVIVGVQILHLMLFLGIPLALLVMRRWRRWGLYTLGWLVTTVLVTLAQSLIPDEDLPPLPDFGLGSEEYASWPPSQSVATAVTAVLLLSPYLRRSWRRFGWILVALLALMRVVTARDVALDIILAIGIGGTVGCALLLLFGRRVELPTPVAVLAALDRVGLHAVDVVRAPFRSTASLPFRATLVDGTQLHCKVLAAGQNEADGLLRTYRRVRMRELGEDVAFSTVRRAAAVESMLAMSAERAQVRTPSMRGLAPLGEGDAMVIAFDRVLGLPLDRVPAERITDDVLDQAWRAVAALRRAGLAHRDLQLSSWMLDEDGALWLIDFSFGEPAASDGALSVDVAELLAATYGVVGAARAVAAAVRGIGAPALASGLSHLVPAALSRSTRQGVRARTDGLAPLVAEAARACDVQQPEFAPIERVRPRTLVMGALMAVAIYVLLPQLADLPRMLQAVREAEPAFVAAALLASVATYVGSAMALLGSMPAPVRVGHALLASVAATFVGAVAPPGVAHVGLNVRFGQKQGLPAAVAVSSTAAKEVGVGAVHVVLLLLLAIVAGSTGTLREELGRLPSLQTIAIGASVALALIGIAAAVPQVRRIVSGSVIPAARHSVTAMRGLVDSPWRMVVLFIGALVLQVGYVACLYFSVRALGGDVGFTTIGLIYLTVGSAASVAPTPGGVGAVEAILLTALTGVGMTAAAALAAVFLYRLATFWLPIPVGGLSMRWLVARDLL